MDQAKARKEKAGERVAELTDDLSALAKANAETIADTNAGQAGVEKAIAILKEFYNNNESTTTGAANDGAADFDMSGNNTQHQAGHNVIVMLEQLLSDFAKLEAETQADESQAAAEYKAFSNKA